jgi:cell division protein ZapA
MADVNILIDGRSYDIACDDGQEARVRHLGAYVDQRVKDLIRSGAAGGQKSQLSILASLMLADEVFDLRDHVASLAKELDAKVQELEHLKSQLNNVRNPEPIVAPAPVNQNIVYSGLEPQEERFLTDHVTKLAARLDRLAKVAGR